MIGLRPALSQLGAGSGLGQDLVQRLDGRRRSRACRRTSWWWRWALITIIRPGSAGEPTGGRFPSFPRGASGLRQRAAAGRLHAGVQEADAEERALGYTDGEGPRQHAWQCQDALSAWNQRKTLNGLGIHRVALWRLGTKTTRFEVHRPSGPAARHLHPQRHPGSPWCRAVRQGRGATG